MFSFLKQNAGVFSYQDIIQWSLEEFFSWLSISNKYIMEERKAYEQARQKAKLER